MLTLSTRAKAICSLSSCHRLCMIGRNRWLLSSVHCKTLVILLIAGLFMLTCGLLLQSSHKMVELRPEKQISPAERRQISSSFSIMHFTRELSPSIVKKIHFMYKAYKIDAHFIPLLKSWRRVYPDYKIYFWTDEELDLLIKRQYFAWIEMYSCDLSNYMERSDVARAFVLDAMGGWYADLDTGCLSRADRLASKHALILPLEPYLHALNNFRMPRLVSNAIMYSAPRHPFWMFYLHQLKELLIDKEPRQSTLDAAFVTGPVLLTKVALKFQQAHCNHTDRPSPWCPYLAPPVQFLPIYDNSTSQMRQLFSRLCQNSLATSVPNFGYECQRFEAHGFRNYQPDPRLSHTFHSFVHLNQQAKGPPSSAKSAADVREWGLDLTVQENLNREIDQLRI